MVIFIVMVIVMVMIISIVIVTVMVAFQVACAHCKIVDIIWDWTAVSHNIATLCNGQFSCCACDVFPAKHSNTVFDPICLLTWIAYPYGQLCLDQSHTF